MKDLFFSVRSDRDASAGPAPRALKPLGAEPDSSEVAFLHAFPSTRVVSHACASSD